jgi:hypothetical protein
MRRCWRKLTTHDIYDVAELFSLADKCTRAMPSGQMCQGNAWHTPPALKAGKCGKPHVSVVVQGSGSKNKKNKKKTGGNNQPLARAPTAAAAAAAATGGRGPRGDKCSHKASGSDDGGTRCPMHNSTCHSVGECWEIKKLTEQFNEKQQQLCQEGAPSHQREGKQKMDPEKKDEDMVF